MISDLQLLQQLPFVLADTHFDFLGKKYSGKVRDNYIAGDVRYLITSDRLSCFDVVVTTIPFKGQVLNQMAVHWFGATGDIVENHLIDVPDPNVMVVKNCETLPVEIIVRSYLAGSALRDYEAGKTISGVQLPPGMRASQRLPSTIITPSTKAQAGSHDLPISEQEILSRGLVAPALWEQVKEISLALFSRGQELAAKQGLILVDTKYEFGIAGGKLLLVDEIHTLDCSRFWKAATYQLRFEKGEAPEMLDKQPTRQWLLAQGYRGEGEIPHFADEERVKIARHYVDSYGAILGETFSGSVGPATERIEKALRNT